MQWPISQRHHRRPCHHPPSIIVAVTHAAQLAPSTPVPVTNVAHSPAAHHAPMSPSLLLHSARPGLSLQHHSGGALASRSPPSPGRTHSQMPPLQAERGHPPNDDHRHHQPRHTPNHHHHHRRTHEVCLFIAENCASAIGDLASTVSPDTPEEATMVSQLARLRGALPCLTRRGRRARSWTRRASSQTRWRKRAPCGCVQRARACAHCCRGCAAARPGSRDGRSGVGIPHARRS